MTNQLVIPVTTNDGRGSIREPFQVKNTLLLRHRDSMPYHAINGKNYPAGRENFPIDGEITLIERFDHQDAFFYLEPSCVHDTTTSASADNIGRC